MAFGRRCHYWSCGQMSRAIYYARNTLLMCFLAVRHGKFFLLILSVHQCSFSSPKCPLRMALKQKKNLSAPCALKRRVAKQAPVDPMALERTRAHLCRRHISTSCSTSGYRIDSVLPSTSSSLERDALRIDKYVYGSQLYRQQCTLS